MKEDMLQENELVIPTKKIYIEIDAENRVTKIFSDVFETPTEKAIFLAEGYEDKFAHAHLYLEKPIQDTAYNYKYENGVILERSEQEKEADIVEVVPELTALDKAEIRIAQLEEELLVTNQYITDLELLVLENLPIQ